MQDQSQKLKQLITELCDLEGLAIDKRNHYYDSFLSIYKDHWRHSYSENSRYFLQENVKAEDSSKVEDSRSEEIVEKMTQLVENLKLIFEIAIKKADEAESDLNKADKSENEPQLKEKCNVARSCRRNIEKLIDHLNLEIVRLNYSKNLDLKVHELVTKTDANNEHLKKQKSAVGSVEERIKSLNDDLSRQRTEYITILGVFSSIVAVLVAGFSLSSAIFANMDKVESFLLYGLLMFIILFVFNILFFLFNFLREMSNRVPHSNVGVMSFNVVLGIIAFVFLCMHFYPDYLLEFIHHLLIKKTNS